MTIANVLLLLFALVQGLLLIRSLAVDEHALRIWIIRALLFGTCFDNLVQLLGVWFIQEPWFYTLSHARFAVHALVLPWLTVFAVDVLASWKIDFAQLPIARICAWTLAIAGIVYGLYADVFYKELVTTDILGVYKYVDADSAPPLATIFANLTVMVLGAILWRKTGWKWLFLGACTIFLVNAATAPFVWGFLAGNLAEVLFILSLIVTDQRVSKLQMAE